MRHLTTSFNQRFLSYGVFTADIFYNETELFSTASVVKSSVFTAGVVQQPLFQFLFVRVLRDRLGVRLFPGRYSRLF